MPKILIADLEKGSNLLTRLLQNKYSLNYAHSVNEVIEMALQHSYDLIIVGVMFDSSRMYDLVKAIKNDKDLQGTPIMGFCDEHTRVTKFSQSLVQSVMSLLGASDYVDTSNLSDAEILKRIEACLIVSAAVASPVEDEARRSDRWRKRLESAGSKKLWSILYLKAGDEKRISGKLLSAAGINAKVTYKTHFKETLAALTLGEFDAVVIDGTSDTDERKSDCKYLRLFLPKLPIVFIGEAQTEDDFEKTEVLNNAKSDELEIALAIFAATGKFNESSSGADKLSNFLLTTLKARLKQVIAGEPLTSVLDLFCLDVEKFAGRRSKSTLKVSVLLLSLDKKHLLKGAAPSLPGEYNEAVSKVELSNRAGSCGTAAYLQKPVFATDISTDIRWADFKDVARAYNLAACWSTPIFDDEHNLLGTFAMYYDEPSEPTDDDLDLIGAVASVAATILSQEKIKEGESEKATTSDANPRRKSILVADEAEGVEVIKKILAADYDLHVVASFDEAKKALIISEVDQRSYFSLIVAGLHFDGSRMFELLQYIRSFDHFEDLAFLPIQAIRTKTSYEPKQLAKTLELLGSLPLLKILKKTSEEETALRDAVVYAFTHPVAANRIDRNASPHIPPLEPVSV